MTIRVTGEPFDGSVLLVSILALQLVLHTSGLRLPITLTWTSINIGPPADVRSYTDALATLANEEEIACCFCGGWHVAWICDTSGYYGSVRQCRGPTSLHSMTYV